MATGLCEGGTARNEGLLESGREGTPMVPYRAVLLLRSFVSCGDHTLAGPVIACDVP
jgi:hypothetical protein